MSSLVIVRPLVPMAVTGSSTFERATTPNPKEAMTVATEGAAISYDFGVAVSLDSAFVGYHTATQGQLFSVYPTATLGGPVGTPLIPATALAALGFGPPYHGFVRAATPVSSRYWTVYLGSGSAYSVGVVALGLAFAAQWGTEFGAGRMITDTGNAERLFGGGFGIDEGARVGGYSWTFGDLQETEIRTLYQLAKDRGTTRSVLVVEDPAQTDGLNERIHWGLFRKLDTYERTDPKNWRWSLQVDDWG